MKTFFLDPAPEIDLSRALERTLDDSLCEGLGSLVRIGCGLERCQHRGLQGGLVLFQIERRLLVRDSPSERPDEETGCQSGHEDPKDPPEPQDRRGAETRDFESIDRQEERQ